MKQAKKLSGLQKVLILCGRVKCGDEMIVWDYAKQEACKESEMKLGSARWRKSEKAKWNAIQDRSMP